MFSWGFFKKIFHIFVFSHLHQTSSSMKTENPSKYVRKYLYIAAICQLLYFYIVVNGKSDKRKFIYNKKLLFLFEALRH